MSGDPPSASDDRQQEPMFGLEGPWTDAWLAPGGGAQKLCAEAMKMEVRWLRRARPRPFGFAPGSAHPVPERIEHAYGAGTLSRGIATILGLRTAVHTMSICYGDRADPLAAAAEIVSDFHHDYQDRRLDEELRDAAGRWGRHAEPSDVVPEDGQVGHTPPKVTPVTTDVAIAGRLRPLAMLPLGDFSAFQFRDEGVLVTVIARHMGPQFPDIVRLTDLEPMLSAMEHPDKELIATAFAEMRRQHIEQRRNQPPTAAEDD
jgi:hypothetical protein